MPSALPAARPLPVLTASTPPSLAAPLTFGPRPPEDPEGLARWREARALWHRVHADRLALRAARTRAVLAVHGPTLARARVAASLTAAGTPDPGLARLHRARATYLGMEPS